MKTKKNRCAWASENALLIDYHDKEWGVPVFDDQTLFEFILLEGAQAGLNWLTVLKKRAAYRQCFHQFDPKKIAKYDEGYIKKLLANEGIIRNRLKVQSAVGNAKAYLDILKEWPSFADYIWQFSEGKSVRNQWKNRSQIPTKDSISDMMSKDLKKRGFKFVGTTICYAFMQAVGMVNDHTVDCFRHKPVDKLMRKQK